MNTNTQPGTSPIISEANTLISETATVNSDTPTVNSDTAAVDSDTAAVKPVTRSVMPVNILDQLGVIDLVYIKKVKCKMADRPLIKSSSDAYKLLFHHWNKGKIGLVEEFKVLFLSRSNRVRQLYSVSQGGITATHADPRLIMAAALKANAKGLILAHNHPSENLQPSCADKSLTKKLKEAAMILNMKVLDHIIVTPNGYFSFAESGLL